MLDEKIDKLDNDFITAWSRYLTSIRKDEAVDVIRILAENGQKDAVACYYLINENHKNEKIKAYLKEAIISHNDYKDKLIIASSLSDDREFYPLSIGKYFIGKPDIYLNGTYTLTGSNVVDGEEIITRNKYGRFLFAASNDLYDYYLKTKDLTALEQFLEIRDTLMVHTSSTLKINTRLQLAKMYRKNPTDVSIGFALGKNLLLLSDSKIMKKSGIKILTKLAQREYSNVINLNNSDEKN